MLPIYLREWFAVLGVVLCLLLWLGDDLAAFWSVWVVCLPVLCGAGMLVLLCYFNCFVMRRMLNLMLVIAWWLSWCFAFSGLGWVLRGFACGLSASSFDV